MSRSRTSKNAVNARTDTEPKATKKKKKTQVLSLPTRLRQKSNRHFLVYLFQQKKKTKKENNPAKQVLLLLLQNTITFQQHSLSLARSVRPSVCPSVTPNVFYCQFCDVAKSEDRPQENLATFGYKPNMKIQKYKNTKHLYIYYWPNCW